VCGFVGGDGDASSIAAAADEKHRGADTAAATVLRQPMMRVAERIDIMVDLCLCLLE
jgi:hypothetical protein